MEEFLNRDVLGLVDVRQLVVIAHLFGVAIGAGAAFFSDFLFTNILKDRKVSQEEFRILKLTSGVVWLGLSVLIITGAMMFLGNPDFYSESAKFLAKMTIVAVLTLNGVIFHLKHIPMLEKYIGKDLRKQKGFRENSKTFFMSGGVSGVSWAAALVLGGLSFIDMSYLQIMGVYFLVAALAAGAGLGLHKRYTS